MAGVKRRDSAAFYDVDGTLIRINIVHAFAFYAMNQTFQQMLQAASKVGGLAIANVLSKVLWGGAILYLLYSKAPFWTLPLPTIASEGLKCVALYVATRNAVLTRVSGTVSSGEVPTATS